MRTKEKARRRVTTGGSLDCPEMCIPLKGKHSTHIVGNSQRDMDEGSICLPCRSVVNGEGTQTLQHVLAKEGLQNACAGMQQGQTLKRKASQIYELPEANLEEPTQSLRRLFPIKGLENACVDMQQSRALKRKASQIYELPEANLEEPQIPPSAATYDHQRRSSQRTHGDYSEENLCMQDHLCLFSFL